MKSCQFVRAIGCCRSFATKTSSSKQQPPPPPPPPPRRGPPSGSHPSSRSSKESTTVDTSSSSKSIESSTSDKTSSRIRDEERSNSSHAAWKTYAELALWGIGAFGLTYIAGAYFGKRFNLLGDNNTSRDDNMFVPLDATSNRTSNSTSNTNTNSYSNSGKSGAREFLEKESHREDIDDSFRKAASSTMDRQRKYYEPVDLSELPGMSKERKSNEFDFRFRVDKEGLRDTLQVMLETCRSEEAQMTKELRQGRTPPNYKQRFRDLRAEKAEIKKHMKGLKHSG